jgi:hypothetical protein
MRNFVNRPVALIVAAVQRIVDIGSSGTAEGLVKSVHTGRQPCAKGSDRRGDSITDM